MKYCNTRSTRRNLMNAAAIIGIQVAAVFTSTAAPAKTLTITSTDSMSTRHPYAESSSQMYSIWCQVYGCLGRYNYNTKQFEGVLVERWETIDNLTWRFHLRRDLVRHDGGSGPTSADVIHSWQQVITDPQSQGRFYFASVSEVKAVDYYTFDIITKEPTAALLGHIFDKFALTSAELFGKHGAEVYNKAPIGWGPYKLRDFKIGDRIVLDRHEEFPEKEISTPQTAVFRRMQEPDQRVTALLNGEVQIARLIPPQLLGRLENIQGIDVRRAPSNEPMFVGFNVNMPPWGDARVRRAAAMAINKDVIIERLLFGLATRLDGPVGPQQLCYTGPLERRNVFNPDAARKLLAEAGYESGGPSVDFYTAVGRYIGDRQVSEAITQMLRNVGFKITLHTPDFANLWGDVRTGKAPMYYMGRGQALEPSDWLSQYFQTGVTPRIGYSNAKLDELFNKERRTFVHEERCQIIRQVSQSIEDEAPAIFLWNHHYVNGVSANVKYEPDASGEIWLTDVTLQTKSQ